VHYSVTVVEIETFFSRLLPVQFIVIVQICIDTLISFAKYCEAMFQYFRIIMNGSGECVEQVILFL